MVVAIMLVGVTDASNGSRNVTFKSLLIASLVGSPKISLVMIGSPDDQC